MRFEILDINGNVINTIKASAEFMAANFPPADIIPEPVIPDPVYDADGNLVEPVPAPEPVPEYDIDGNLIEPPAPVYETYVQYRVVAETDTAPVLTVSMAQAQKALVLSGVALSSVQAALEAIVDPTERELALIDWNKSPTVSSDSDLVVSMAEALSLTADDVTALFELAESL